MKKVRATPASQAMAYRMLDRASINWLGVAFLVLILGIVYSACFTQKQVDGSLTTLAASVGSFIGGRLSTRPQQQPPGTITATPPARITTASPQGNTTRKKS